MTMLIKIMRIQVQKKCAPLQGLCLVLNQSTLQELQAKDGDYDERSKQMFVDLQNG